MRGDHYIKALEWPCLFKSKFPCVYQFSFIRLYMRGIIKYICTIVKMAAKLHCSLIIMVKGFYTYKIEFKLYYNISGFLSLFRPYFVFLYIIIYVHTYNYYIIMFDVKAMFVLIYVLR